MAGFAGAGIDPVVIGSAADVEVFANSLSPPNTPNHLSLGNRRSLSPVHSAGDEMASRKGFGDGATTSISAAATAIEKLCPG